MEFACEETNSYVAGAEAPRTWYDTHVKETKAFIGILIIMGISKFSSLEMYGSINNRFCFCSNS